VRVALYEVGRAGQRRRDYLPPASSAAAACALAGALAALGSRVVSHPCTIEDGWVQVDIGRALDRAEPVAVELADGERVNGSRPT